MKPWEKQNNESSKAFKAFCVYRDMDSEDRSLAKVAGFLGKSVTWIEDWSVKHKWVYRVSQYDAYLDNLDRKERERRRRELLRKKEEGGKALQSKFVAFMKKHKDQEVNSLPLAIDCFTKGLALEEEALGENQALEEFMERYEEFKRKLWLAVEKLYGKDAPEKIMCEIKNTA